MMMMMFIIIIIISIIIVQIKALVLPVTGGPLKESLRLPRAPAQPQPARVASSRGVEAYSV